MGLFLFAGVVLMLSHHFFCKYLDGQPVDALPIRNPRLYSHQSVGLEHHREHHRIRFTHCLIGGNRDRPSSKYYGPSCGGRSILSNRSTALVSCKGEPFTLSALPDLALRRSGSQPSRRWRRSWRSSPSSHLDLYASSHQSSPFLLLAPFVPFRWRHPTSRLSPRIPPTEGWIS